jgi:hypothetical protein
MKATANTHFALMPLAEVRPGMILSDVVLDARGNVLLSQGVALTDTLLASLARHGIDTLAIHLPDHGEAPPAIDDEAVQARLDHLFRDNRRDDHNDWATGILRRYVEDYRLQRDTQAEGQP